MRKGSTSAISLVSALILQALTGLATSALAQQGSSAAPGTPASATATRSGPQKTEIERLARAIEIVRRRYVSEPESATLVDNAIRGMLTRLDPDAHYLSPAELASLRAAERATAGIGLHFRKEPAARATPGGLLVIAADDGSPAARAGLRSRDLVTAIDARSVDGRMSISEAARLLGGRAGDPVRLTVVRRGVSEPLTLTLLRAPTSGRMSLRPTPAGVVVARISLFAGQNGQRFVEQLEAMSKSYGPRLNGLVLDLRDAAGGAIDQAVRVADAFLDLGTIANVRTRRGGQERLLATPGDVTLGKPIVVLVNSGTASGAEVVAGALKDRRRATILGAKTAGRANKLSLVPIGERGASGAVLLPVTRYETPEGRAIDGKGIEPDVAIVASTTPADCRDGDYPEADGGGACVSRGPASDPDIERAIALVTASRPLSSAPAGSDPKRP
jgi:carboxyl-terminal processing protease